MMCRHLYEAMRRKPVPKWVAKVLGDSLSTTPDDEAREPEEKKQNDETGTDEHAKTMRTMTPLGQATDQTRSSGTGSCRKLAE